MPLAGSHELINVNVNEQVGGTCWFHALYNIIILSRGIRPFVYRSLYNYISERRRNTTFFNRVYNRPSCISNSANIPHSRLYFMKRLFVTFISPFGTGKRNSRNQAKNILPTRRNIQRNDSTNEEVLKNFFIRIGLNFTLANVNNNGVTQLQYQSNDGDDEKDIFIIRHVFGTPANITRLRERATININNRFSYGPKRTIYVLECAQITLLFRNSNSNRPTGHSISGFKYNNKYYIIDSNISTPIECDWRKPNNILDNPEYKNLSTIYYSSPWIGIGGIVYFYINNKASEECSKKYNKNSLSKLINSSSLLKIRRSNNLLRNEYNALNKINKNTLLGATKNNAIAFNKFKKTWITNQNYINWSNSGRTQIPFTSWKKLGMKLRPKNYTWTLFGKDVTNRKTAERNAKRRAALEAEEF